MKKNKLVAAGAALFLALVSTLALVRFVRGAEKRAVAGEELVDVFVAKANIKAGTASAELGELIELLAVQAKVRPKNAVTALSQIDSLVTSVDIVEGEQLLTTRFINPGSFQGARTSSVLLPKGANEVTLKLAPERVLGGQLRPGDTVTVLASFAPFDFETPGADGQIRQLAKSPNSSHVLLNGVTVVRIQVPEDTNVTDRERNGVGVAPSAELYVTLAVDQPALERVVFAAEFGKIWLSFEPADADSTQNQVVDRSNVYTETPPLLGAPRTATSQELADDDAPLTTAAPTPAVPTTTGA